MNIFKEKQLENKANAYKCDFKKLKLKDIKDFYKTNSTDLTLGVEYERISLDKNTLKTAPVYKVQKIVEQMAYSLDWTILYDDNVVIGAFDEIGNSISLEPACQLEISLKPYKNIEDIEKKLFEIVDLSNQIAKIYDVVFLPTGVNPIDDIEDIELLNKKRYLIMDKYLPYSQNGELSQKMMRKTAGIQVNIDYFNNSDLYYKLKLLNQISPYIMGLSANSVFENNSLSGYKSTRAHIWHYTDNDRCNYFYNDIFEGLNNFKTRFNVVSSYVEKILEIPIIYIVRDDKIIPFNGKVNFREFMKNGHMGYFATLNDYILHQSLCFPDIRVKKYIEIRNHDSAETKYAIAYCALYKGLFLQDSKKTLNIFKFLNNSSNFQNSKLIAKYGLDVFVDKKHSGWDVVEMLLNIAQFNLQANEREYLQPLIELSRNKKTQADLILEKNITLPSEQFRQNTYY